MHRAAKFSRKHGHRVTSFESHAEGRVWWEDKSANEQRDLWCLLLIVDFSDSKQQRLAVEWASATLLSTSTVTYTIMGMSSDSVRALNVSPLLQDVRTGTPIISLPLVSFLPVVLLACL